MSVQTVLIVDDEPKMGMILQRALKGAGYEATAETDPLKALAQAVESPPDVVLCDLKMPQMDGIAFLEQLKAKRPETDVVMMTAYATVQTAVEAMKKGAYDYLIKPFPIDELKLLLERLGERRALREENVRLRERVGERVKLENIITASPQMEQVLAQVRKVAPTQAGVLLRGESGTGKEILAEAIHYLSPRADKPFIKVNCGAIPENLLEAELFGHVKGAFTGAVGSREGHFAAADGGSIFLDEIAEMTPALQVKLLRVLQEKEFTRVGESKPRKVDVRIIAATNQDLEAMLSDGRFRHDLYYRLNVVQIFIPPLRERRDDIPVLIEHFCRRYAPKGTHLEPSLQAYEVLIQYPWPGNIRELENAIEHAMVMCEGKKIEIDDLPLAIRQWAAQKHTGEITTPTSDLQSGPETLEAMEIRAICDAMAKTGNNRTRAARLLGITRRTLGYRIQKYGLRFEADESAG